MLKKTTINTTPLHKKNVATWEYAKPSHRFGRNMTAEMMGTDVDSNGAPIDNRE